MAALTETHAVAQMPHSPYFALGWLATLQLQSALPNSGLIERLHVDLEADLYGDLVDPGAEGCFRVPQEPGLGPDPDPDVTKHRAVKQG